MASNPSSGASTPNARFTSQKKTAEDLLSTQTVGLVNLSDFRKRRAEALEQKERDTQDLLTGTGTISGTASGRATPDGASTPREPPVKKKKRKVGTPKLSFGMDEEDDGESTDAATPLSGSASPRSGTPLSAKDSVAKKKGVNSNVALAPRLLTKSALLKEAQTRESLRKEFLVLQEAVKATEINIPFVFYDGTNIPGGVCTIKKGDYAWVFLDRSRKVGADLGVGEKVNSRREWARIGVDDLMMVRGNIIIPHHYDFYYFVINHTLGPGNRLLFDYSSEPPSKSTPPSSEINLDTYNPLSVPSKTKPKDVPTDKKDLEGTADDPTYTKVVDRRWYERNKHIFPASVWQEFDPEKDYQKEVKRDAGGNAFFFS
ncbi:FAM50-like protein [Lachnellula hyalina]|uniref:FAM50-like protein n=1 Tax=Lachnellula hyalina TaxID=1316788 RepID=A0A8H8TWZ0_9HELO|nr:FAM50-like protein [Lachnellula hyalina]TVY25449.1 FAM50-like protein [Lachnellula hyalina]